MPTPNPLAQSGVDFIMGATPSKVQGTPTRGVPNPYGVGASAYEPNTVIYNPSTDPLMAGSEAALGGIGPVEQAAADAAQAAADTTTTTANAGDGGAPMATGSALAFINAAKQLLGKPYVWGGTTINGTDCSGLLYYALNKAGVKMPRYRAADYGKMGQQVTAQDAQPGDIVYWDEPGSTDHVGIYLGNGMVLNSPHSGTVTQIDKVWGAPTYRRILNDSGFSRMALPGGSSELGYNGQPASSLFTTTTPRVGDPILGTTRDLYAPNAISGFRR